MPASIPSDPAAAIEMVSTAIEAPNRPKRKLASTSGTIGRNSKGNVDWRKATSEMAIVSTTIPANDATLSRRFSNACGPERLADPNNNTSGMTSRVPRPCATAQENAWSCHSPPTICMTTIPPATEDGSGPTRPARKPSQTIPLSRSR